MDCNWEPYIDCNFTFCIIIHSIQTYLGAILRLLSAQLFHLLYIIRSIVYCIYDIQTYLGGILHIDAFMMCLHLLIIFSMVCKRAWVPFFI